MKNRKVIGPFEFSEGDPEMLDIVALFRDSSLHNARACLKVAAIAFYWSDALLYQAQSNPQILRAIDLSLSALDTKSNELRVLRARLLRDDASEGLDTPENPDEGGSNTLDLF
jgi:hypothetical protein